MLCSIVVHGILLVLLLGLLVVELVVSGHVDAALAVRAAASVRVSAVGRGSSGAAAASGDLSAPLLGGGWE